MINLGIPQSEYPGCVNSCAGKILVCGGGHTLWDDMQRTHWPGSQWSVMCVNDCVMHLPGKVDHLFSNDFTMLGHWLNARRPILRRDHGPVGKVHTLLNKGHYISWPWPGNGTSALGAVYTCLALGYDEIILCGIPLDNGPHYFDAPWVNTNFLNEVPFKNSQMKYWQNARDTVFEGKVSSMSGRTQEILGAPE